MKKKKRKNLKMNVSNIYIVVAFIFILGFGFFGTSKIYIAENIPINQSELNTEFDLRSNGKFSLNSWVYDKEKNKMEIILVTNGMKDYSSELDFTSVSKNDLKKELPLEVVYKDNDIYIIQIKKVPKNFDQVAIRLHKTERNISDVFEEDKEKSDNNKVISTIYTDERVVEKTEIIEKDFKNYALQVTENLIEKSFANKEKLEKDIEKINSFNEELLVEIGELEAELLYQTVNEQIDTNNLIYRFERDIEMKNKDKEIMLQDIKNIEAKIERLNQKKRDISL